MSFPVLNSFNLLINNKDYFKNKGITIVPCVDFLDAESYNKIMDNKTNLLLTDAELWIYQTKIFDNFYKALETSDLYNNSICIGFHPVGWSHFFETNYYNLLNKKKIKTIVWQNDPHLFAKMAKQPMFTEKKYISPILNNATKIVGPSTLYFKNLNMYIDKIYEIPYFLNKDWFSGIEKDFNKKTNTIALFGNLAKQYKLRHAFFNMKKNNTKLSKYIVEIPHCGYDRSKPNFLNNCGPSLYNKLSTHKMIVSGAYDWPCNYELAKTLEIMASNCVCITDKSEFLDKFGFKPNVHYLLPKYSPNNELIDDPDYYINLLNTNVGKNIANNAYKLVWELFDERKGCDFYIKFFNEV